MTKRELMRALARAEAERDKARMMIAEAYQVVGALAHITGTSDHPDVVRALDNFAIAGEGEVPHPDLLPWPKETFG